MLRLNFALNIAGSSNGRTAAFGAVYLGSNPGPAARVARFVTMQSLILKSRCVSMPPQIGGLPQI